MRAPDLVKVYDTLQNAALLNYYFFYPAHEESLLDCTNTEAVEFGCFAGEWGCLSLLLERADATSDYRPSYIGTSGRLLAAPIMPVAQAADDDDTAKRTVMTVDAFNKATSTTGIPASSWRRAHTHSISRPAPTRWPIRTRAIRTSAAVRG